MSIRVNTLGKSALINRQLNSAYDIVEYVADNLPLLMDLCKRLNAIKLAQESFTFINHIENKDIHLSKIDKEAINKIDSIVSLLETNGIDITNISTSLQSLEETLNNHINNSSHITQEEREKWNSINIPKLSVVATTGSYNDLLDKPEIDIPNITIDKELSDTSDNPVENKAIKKELDKYALRENISSVGFSGQYADLKGKPKGDTELDLSSENWVCNKTITKAIQDLSNSIEVTGKECCCEALTNTDIDEVLNG